jgi:hypothetical protein
LENVMPRLFAPDTRWFRRFQDSGLRGRLGGTEHRIRRWRGPSPSSACSAEVVAATATGLNVSFTTNWLFTASRPPKLKTVYASAAVGVITAAVGFANVIPKRVGRYDAATNDVQAGLRRGLDHLDELTNPQRRHGEGLLRGRGCSNRTVGESVTETVGMPRMATTPYFSLAVIVARSPC